MSDQRIDEKRLAEIEARAVVGTARAHTREREAFVGNARTDVLDLVADLRAARERIDLALDVIGESGCDCDEGCDSEYTCEEAGHEPCLAHRIERALTGGAS